LAQKLARQLPARDSFSLWRTARALWEDSDHGAVRAAYLYWAAESSRRGFPLPAAEALNEAPADSEVLVARARALERAGRYRDALDLLDDTPATPSNEAVRGAVLWRLGRPDEAWP